MLLNIIIPLSRIAEKIGHSRICKPYKQLPVQ